MGLDLNAVQFLLRAHRQGVSFESVLTIGRLKLDVFPTALLELLRRRGLPVEPFPEQLPQTVYAEPFFRCLGAKNVCSLDASDYEGASFIHDLNQPIPAEWRERFDVVCDGGTLEHVFNFPVALRNCMEMVRADGHLFLDAPGNNWFGHGFYQFSPELFYRALSEGNGYEVVEMIAHAAGPQARWYRVADPTAVQSRVELISYTLIHLLVCARRNRIVELFRQMPQQSDYTVLWRDATAGKRTDDVHVSRFVRLVSRYLPRAAAMLKAANTAFRFYSSHSLRNRRFFVPVAKE